MAALTITAASVAKGTGARTAQGTAGATITAGQVVYLDSADGLYKLADCNGAAALRAPVGIALHAALTGQPLTILEGGPITIGSAVTAGVAYYLGGAAGSIVPVADLTTGDYPTILGIATSTTVINVNIQQSGAVLL